MFSSALTDVLQRRVSQPLCRTEPRGAASAPPLRSRVGRSLGGLVLGGAGLGGGRGPQPLCLFVCLTDRDYGRGHQRAACPPVCVCVCVNHLCVCNY